jgi:hypothetical protein
MALQVEIIRLAPLLKYIQVQALSFEPVMPAQETQNMEMDIKVMMNAEEHFMRINFMVVARRYWYSLGWPQPCCRLPNRQSADEWCDATGAAPELLRLVSKKPELLKTAPVPLLVKGTTGVVIPLQILPAYGCLPLTGTTHCPHWLE